MKHTKQNVIKVMEAIATNKHEIAKMHRHDGNENGYDTYMSESICYQSAIELLINKEYFDAIAKTYGLSDSDN